jgi:RHS repeat-associated protein
MRKTQPSSIYILFVLILLYCSPSAAQVATGTPPFGSFGGGPDVINLGSLNSHIRVPMVSKAGRGMPFTYNITYDTSVWYPVSSNGTQAWQPVTNWGWQGETEVALGYVVFPLRTTTQTCHEIINGRMQTYYATYESGAMYHDSLGVAHYFGIFEGGCAGVDVNTNTATDGSGLTYDSGTITTRWGQVINAPHTQTGSGTKTDRNGNQISTNGSSFTDTLGTTVLTLSGGGTPSSPITFTYTPPSGTNVSYTMKYGSYNVLTNFGCSGITEYSATGVSLVSEIDLPDGTKYSFTYEPTPGHSGDVTGRLASVTLPTGGSISYTYTGSNNGIECSDGSTAGLNRTVNPGGEWQYTRSGSGSAWGTTVTDPQGNQTGINFQQESTTQNFFETMRWVYQGPASANNWVAYHAICYNGSTGSEYNCNNVAITLPITEREVISYLPPTANLQSQHIDYYNSNGLVYETDERDYGAGFPGTFLRKTLTTYASLGNGIVGMPATVTVEDGPGNVKSQTTYTYDQGGVTATSGTPQHVAVSGSRGNATTVSRLVQGSTTLSKNYTYYDTGNVKTATDVNGAVTTYTYGSGASCGNSFVTSVSEPLSLSRSMTWNCTGGVQTSLTDENGQPTTTTYTDPYFWRRNKVTDAASSVASFTYQAATSVEGAIPFGNSTIDALTTVDSLGRTHISQLREGPSSGIYDSVETDYDSDGRLSRITLPYQAGAGVTNSSAPSTVTTYDALGRKYQVTDSATKTVTYTYSQDDTYRTVGPAPPGENTKRKQFEYDALGRLLSVCEVTSANGSGSCGQTNAANGYVTKYSYDATNHLTGVIQNGQTANQQTRAYFYDNLGRMTSETNPESGTTTYTYDTDSTCGTSNGDLVKKIDAVGNTTCYAHDGLHRITSTTYSGPYAPNTPSRHFIYDAATVNSVAMGGAKTRLAEAYTCVSCSTKITDLGFSYTALGQPRDVYESTANSHGYYHVTNTYYANRALNQISNLIGLPTITYGVDGEGRIYSASASSGQNPLTSTMYNPASLPTQVNLGSSDSDSYTFDPSTNRMTQYKFNVNGEAVTGTLTWNDIGTLETLVVADQFYSPDNQTCSYSHDDMSRIASVNCGSSWSQTFSYDAFGNLSKSGTISFQPTYSYLTNRMTQIGSSTPTYDTNGNVLNDTAHTYAWDVNGKPVTIDGVGLTYDALGRMVEQSKNGVYTQIVYAPTGGKLAIMSGQTLQKAFVPLTGGAVAVYNSSGLEYYRHSDWLGSSRFASTPARAMYFDGAYAPFGENYAQTGTTDLSFTGMNQDTVANLFDFPGREYNGIHGRWPSPDPAGLSSVRFMDPRTLNRYAYVRNSPMSHIDPTGMEDADCDETCDDGSGGGGGDGGAGNGGADDSNGGDQQQGGGGTYGGAGASGPWAPPNDPSNPNTSPVTVPGTTVTVDGGDPGQIDTVDPQIATSLDSPSAAATSATITAGAVDLGAAVYTGFSAGSDAFDAVVNAIGTVNPDLVVSAGRFIEGVDLAEGSFTSGIPETLSGEIGASADLIFGLFFP